MGLGEGVLPHIGLASFPISASRESNSSGSNARNICCLSGAILSNTNSICGDREREGREERERSGRERREKEKGERDSMNEYFMAKAGRGHEWHTMKMKFVSQSNYEYGTVLLMNKRPFVKDKRIQLH